MSDAQAQPSGAEYASLIVGALGGLGSAVGGLVAVIQYAPSYTYQILAGLIVLVSLLAFAIYLWLGHESLIAKASIGLALAFVTSLSAAIVFMSRPPRPAAPATAAHSLEVHAADDSLDPIDPNTVRNFKIVVINTNETRQRIEPARDATQIDLSHAKIVSITACNVTTEYNVEGLAAIEKQLAVPITVVVGVRAGSTCVERNH